MRRLKTVMSGILSLEISSAFRPKLTCGEVVFK